MTTPIKKTSNPFFTEGKDLNGVPPTPPRTDSMFDRHKQEDLSVKKPSNNNAVHGQRHTGHPGSIKNRITTPSGNQSTNSQNPYIYFDSPGDFNGNQGG